MNKRKLGILLSADSYIDVWSEVFIGNEKKTMKKLLKEANWYQFHNDYQMTVDKGKQRYVFKNKDNDEDWYVGQIFELNETQYALVWHHAFDGVDFELLGQFDSYEDALEARNKAIHETIDDWQDPFNKTPKQDETDFWNGDSQISWDTGEEWYVWSILNVSNTSKN